MLRDQFVELCKVACLLVVHVLHELLEMGVCPDDLGCLGIIYENCSQFACLVYTELEGMSMI